MNRAEKRGFGKRRAAFLLRWFVIPALLAFGSGCATRIIPPENVPDPTTVSVMNYGLHSSLILPGGTGESVEYAYGQWKWFAQGKTDPWRVCSALFWPAAGTIGRRPLPFPASDEMALHQDGAKSAISFRVSAAAALRLEHQLDGEMAESSETLFNANQQMYFAKVPELYWGGHNCNTVLAQWLSELGCEIKGPALLSNFHLKSWSAPPAQLDGKPQARLDRR